MSTLRQTRLAEAQRIAETALAENRDFTVSEKAKVDDLIAKVRDADAAKADGTISNIFDWFAKASGTDYRSSDRRYLAPVRTMAKDLATAMERARTHSPTFGTKALLVAGDVYADIPMLTADPFAQPRPPATLIDALPVARVSTPTFTYLRQTTRTNNAAPVAMGGTKPTSLYGLTDVPASLHVIAHVSEAFDEFWVQDSPGLERFLEAEMVYGLRVALEDQVLNGTGVAPAITGIANTSGIQVQAYDTSVFTSCRKGITKAEVLGYAPRFFVMAAADWESIELSAYSSGNYVLNAEGQGNLPVDAAARRLWGVPVVLSTAQAAGGCYLISSGSVELVSDGRVQVQTSNATSDDFLKNQLRMRVEGRWELAVTAPSGIVSIDLAA